MFTIHDDRFVIAFLYIIHIVYFYDSHALYFLLLPSHSCLVFSSSPTYSLFHFQVSIYLIIFDDPKSFIRIARRVLTATNGYTTEENLPEPLKCYIFSRKWGAS